MPSQTEGPKMSSWVRALGVGSLPSQLRGLGQHCAQTGGWGGTPGQKHVLKATA